MNLPKPLHLLINLVALDAERLELWLKLVKDKRIIEEMKAKETDL